MSTQHEDQGTPSKPFADLAREWNALADKHQAHADRRLGASVVDGTTAAVMRRCARDLSDCIAAATPHATDQGTHVVVTNAPPWMTPQEVAERLKVRGKPVPRVTVDGVTREPDEPWDDGPGVNLFLPSLNDPRGRREDSR